MGTWSLWPDTDREHHWIVADDAIPSTPDPRALRRTTLPDGRVLVIRPAEAADVDRMMEFYRNLPLEDRYFRFFTGGLPPRTHFEKIVDTAIHGGVALVVDIIEGSDAKLVGDACYVPQPDGDGELAVTIDPDWRGWLGPYLLDALLEAAAVTGMTTLRAEILVRNRPMLALVRARGCVTIGDDDLSKVRVAVGTSARTPSWPAHEKRRRILVEAANPRWRSGLTAIDPNVSVMVCGGPPRGYRDRCPVLSGHPCPLAADADAIVMARSRDDPLGRDLIDAHVRANPQVPLLIEASVDQIEHESLPAGSRPLPRALTDEEALARILETIDESARDAETEAI
jgi:acetyltransferase